MQGNDDEQVTLLLKTSEIINRHTSVEDLHLTGKLTCLDTQLLGTAADGHEHWLSGSEEVVGRGHDCSIVINSPELSRRHARFTAYSDKWVVEDCGSRNGVWLNNERVEPRKTVSNGDTIRFGRIPFRFEVVSMTATEAADKAAASGPTGSQDTGQAMQETVAVDLSDTGQFGEMFDAADTHTQHRKLVAQAKVAVDEGSALDNSLQSLSEALPDIIDSLVQKARDGDVEAAKACIDLMRWSARHPS